jgi:hypothetical protein
LSRSSGQVPHVLLTRSPLSTRASPGFSFDLHVLGAPPAFVLSQDQTLHRDFNPTGKLVEHEIGELPVRVTSAPFRQLCTTAPEGVSPCGIDDDVSRDTPALAFGVTVPFSRSHHSTPEPLRALRPRNRPASAEPTLTSASTTPAMGGAGEKRPCQSTRKMFSGRTGDTTGWPPGLQAGTPNSSGKASVPGHGIERHEEEPQG